jgi:hypothetical protein
VYFRYRFTQLNRTTVEPQFKGARGFFLYREPPLNQFKIQINFNFKKGMKAVLGNYTTSLTHDGNDEIADMEETNDVIPVNGEKP